MIVGIDPSTRRISWVCLSESEPFAMHCHGTLEMTAEPAITAYTWAVGFEREHPLAATSYWIEQPFGRFPEAIAKVNRVIGAMLAALPDANLVTPPTWKRGNDLKGNAQKPEVAVRALEHYPQLERSPAFCQDLLDAALIARLGLVENLKIVT